MKTHNKHSVYLSVALATITFCLPLGADSADFWSGRTKITELYPTRDALAFNAEYSNSLSLCDNGTRFVLRMTVPNYQVMASSLLAAYIGGKDINFHFDDLDGAVCAVEIDRFRVLD